MDALMIFAAVVVLALAVMLFEMLRTPAGIEREHRIEQGRIFSRTRTVTGASPDEVIALLQTDWSWWKRAHAQPMQDLGGGRKEFLFHPVRYFDLIEVPPAFVVRLEKIETLPGGGKRIDATLRGDFDGRAEYVARSGPDGTIVELAWLGAEPRNLFRFAPIALVARIHCWRERIGMQGLRSRLASSRSQPA